MWETFIAFAWFFSWPVLLLAGILAIASVHNDSHGWSAIWSLFAAFVIWGIVSPSWVIVLIGMLAYVPIGLFWSYWRWRRHCSSIVRKVEDNDIDKREARGYLDPKTRYKDIASWVIAWPFSIVEAALGDFIDVINVLVRKWFKNMYAKVSASALREIDELDD